VEAPPQPPRVYEPRARPTTRAGGCKLRVQPAALATRVYEPRAPPYNGCACEQKTTPLWTAEGAHLGSMSLGLGQQRGRAASGAVQCPLYSRLAADTAIRQRGCGCGGDPHLTRLSALRCSTRTRLSALRCCTRRVLPVSGLVWDCLRLRPSGWRCAAGSRLRVPCTVALDVRALDVHRRCRCSHGATRDVTPLVHRKPADGCSSRELHQRHATTDTRRWLPMVAKVVLTWESECVFGLHAGRAQQRHAHWRAPSPVFVVLQHCVRRNLRVMAADHDSQTWASSVGMRVGEVQVARTGQWNGRNAMCFD